MDYVSLIDALTAKYAPSAITPPVGQENIKFTDWRLPNNLPQTPAITVEGERGELVNDPGRRMGQHHFAVRLYLGKTAMDQPREAAVMYAWLGVLIDLLNAGSKLGLAPLVMKALMTAYTFGVLTYAGTDYDGIELKVTVWTEETIQLTP